ncbi:MAG TPA: hypothetical protein VGD50_05310, partial [Candidatus Baltobacteraceae bacterium]
MRLLCKLVLFGCFTLGLFLFGSLKASAAPCDFSLAQNPVFTASLAPWQNSGGWYYFLGTSQGEARDSSAGTGSPDTLSQMVYGVVPGTVLTVQTRFKYFDIFNPGKSDGVRLDVSYGGVVYASFSTALAADAGGVGTMTARNGATISPATLPNITRTVVYSITLPAGVPEQGLLQVG